MLEKYYRIDCSSGFAGEDETRVLKLVGDDLQEIEEIVEDNYNELYSNATINAINNLSDYQDQFEDEDELFEEANFYVTGSCDKILTNEFEELTHNVESDYNYKQNDIIVYVWNL